MKFLYIWLENQQENIRGTSKLDVSSKSSWQISDFIGSAWQQSGSGWHLHSQDKPQSTLPYAGPCFRKQWETAEEEGCERAEPCKVQIHRETGNDVPTVYLFHCTLCTLCIGKSLEQDLTQTWITANGVGLYTTHKQHNSFTRNFTRLISPWSSN